MKERLINVGKQILKDSTYLVQETPIEAYTAQIHEMDKAEAQLRSLPDHSYDRVLTALTDPDATASSIRRAAPGGSERDVKKIQDVYTYLLTSSGSITDEIGPHCPVNYTNGRMTSPDFLPRTTIKLKMSPWGKFDIPLTEAGRIHPPSIWRKLAVLPLVLRSEYKEPNGESCDISYDQGITLVENMPAILHEQNLPIKNNYSHISGIIAE